MNNVFSISHNFSSVVSIVIVFVLFSNLVRELGEKIHQQQQLQPNTQTSNLQIFAYIYDYDEGCSCRYQELSGKIVKLS